MTESYLHYLWCTKRYTKLEPIGEIAFTQIEVLDPGLLNRDAGPDFFNAKVRINNIVWVGNVEIHRSATEWYQHRHHLDARYDSVILHIVLESNVSISRSNGTPLPTCVMHLPDDQIDVISLATNPSHSMPCSPIGSRLSSDEIYSWLGILSRSRLLRRVERIRQMYQDMDFSWPATLYTLLVRHFGFGLNNDAMEALARSLPLRYILKERSQLGQIEALILGQAGLIDSFPDEGYRVTLQRAYDFLRHKYQLVPLESSRFIKARTRPANHPLPRLLQLSWLLYRIGSIHSAILECRDLKRLGRWLNQEASPTLLFVQAQKQHQASLISRQLLYTLAINVVIPYQISYAHVHLNEALAARANQWLSDLPPEQNRHTRALTQQGVMLRCASDSQGVIELRTHYCEARKCVFCPWGRSLLSIPMP